jgi:hypothetical protein
VPTGSELIAQVATPLLMGWAEQPVIVVPFAVNCTVPVGVVLPTVGATVAVKVTETP